MFVLILFGYAHTVEGQEPPDVDLSGMWVLNEAESDDPSEHMRGRRDGGRMDEGRRPPRRRDGQRGRRPGRGGMDREAMRERMESLRDQRLQFAIEQGENAVTLMYPGQGVVEIPTTGEEVTAAWPGVGDVKVRAGWNEDGTLEIERRLERGFMMTTSYTLDPKSSRLVVVAGMDGPRAREIRSVYDAAEE